jgi:hypothetical protein
MPDQKETQFFSEVLAKTRVGKIPWEKTAAEQTYIAPVAGQFTLSISELIERDRLGNEAFDYVLKLSDSDERVLSSVSASESGVFLDLRELYATARRQALQVDAKLDSVLGELRKL